MVLFLGGWCYNFRRFYANFWHFYAKYFTDLLVRCKLFPCLLERASKVCLADDHEHLSSWQQRWDVNWEADKSRWHLWAALWPPLLLPLGLINTCHLKCHTAYHYTQVFPHWYVTVKKVKTRKLENICTRSIACCIRIWRLVEKDISMLHLCWICDCHYTACFFHISWFWVEPLSAWLRCVMPLSMFPLLP